ncbi:hypothetical protein AKJ65_04060 [candidate division MSBL1 archaeon SCGC-AAA259E19]|uniref:Uncharacterized protein n=2 Tax=candidate division MSBL1 TaxID=215777 RepID=A0A133UG07_9EURY|nr:hypothetical protein AKJ64_01315 [candidate division MSBL1 archaeon SCGC-AAA259E17]KXA94558.1 hypothetical protein AKJ65_04060 [candidate division MSBL1 archaeon SCGC-AAA259E19]
MKLRRLYFLFSVTLYNLGIFTRNGSERPRAREFKEWLEFELLTLKVLEEYKAKPPPPLSA